MNAFDPPPDPVMRRCCLHCGSVYTGRLRCPACDFGMGRPLNEDDRDGQDKQNTHRRR